MTPALPATVQLVAVNSSLCRSKHVFGRTYHKFLFPVSVCNELPGLSVDASSARRGPTGAQRGRGCEGLVTLSDAGRDSRLGD